MRKYMKRKKNNNNRLIENSKIYQLHMFKITLLALFGLFFISSSLFFRVRLLKNSSFSLAMANRVSNP